MLSHFLTNIINNNLHYFFEKMSVQEKLSATVLLISDYFHFLFCKKYAVRLKIRFYRLLIRALFLEMQDII